MDWRLKNRKEIQALLQAKIKVHSNLMMLAIRKTKNHHHRFVIIISKKNAQRANVRNYVRRQIRAMIREIDFSSYLVADIAIIVKREFLEQTYQQKKYVLQKSLRKVLLKES